MQRTQFAIATAPTAPVTFAPEPHIRSHYFFDRDDVQSLSHALANPYQHYIEMREYVHLGQVLQFIRTEHPHTSLSITTDMAFHQPTAEFFTAHLAHRQPMKEDLASDIKTCLQEAIMNSIIHGNLQIESGSDNIDGFTHYLEAVSTRINDECLSLKRISIFAWFRDEHITLCVSDQGKGFDIHQPAIDETKPYGRGLALIRGLAASSWQTAPNNIYIQFQHD